MTEYKLTTPKDMHGQPIRLFKANADNNASKAIDQLTGVCTGILADGEVSEAEAVFFAQWVRKFAELGPVWPFTEVLARVERIFMDGRCDDDEREELKGVMQSLCGYTSEASSDQTYSTTLPLDDPLPELIFPEREYVITGKFAYGTRKKVFEAIAGRGGVPVDTHPTKRSHYLVVGLFSSRDWISTHHGRKIERAQELRHSGSGIAIISEEHWNRGLT